VRRWLLGAVLLLLVGPGEAAAATRTSAFAPVDPGVRAAALGGAYSALGGDPGALYWNPATLFFQTGRSIEASYSDLYSLGLARRTFLTFGMKKLIEVSRFDGDRVVVTEDRESGAAFALGLHSLFVDVEEDGYSELGVGGGAAWGYGDRLSVGLAARGLFVSSDFDEVSATGYNVGLGIAYRTSSRGRLGLSSPQLLSRLIWKFDSNERLPVNAILAYSHAFDLGLVVNLEGEIREGEPGPYRLAGGAEWWIFPERLALRAGYRHLAGDLEDVSQPSFGAGLRLSSLRFDYALRMEPDALGDTHRVGILVGF
jgi:hypothetical protein